MFVFDRLAEFIAVVEVRLSFIGLERLNGCELVILSVRIMVAVAEMLVEVAGLRRVLKLIDFIPLRNYNFSKVSIEARREHPLFCA